MFRMVKLRGAGVSIAVLHKAFLVLEAIGGLERPASLKELAELTQLPKPTLFRVLRTLGDLGYVSQDGSRGDYLLGAKLYQLARNGGAAIRERALPAMEALHKELNETVNLGILQGDSIYYLHFIETTQSLRWQVRPGARDPFYSTALGRAVVAALPEQRRDKLLNRDWFAARTERTPTSREAIMAAIDATAKRGWAEDLEENDVGVCCFAVPLMAEGTPIAGISVSIPASRLNDESRKRIVDALLSLKSGALVGSLSSEKVKEHNIL